MVKKEATVCLDALVVAATEKADLKFTCDMKTILCDMINCCTHTMIESQIVKYRNGLIESARRKR